MERNSFRKKIAHSSDAVLKRLVIRLQDGAARILPTAGVDTKAFAFLPTLLRGFRQVDTERARDTFFPTESAECKNFAEMVRTMTRKSWSNSTLQLLACRWKERLVRCYRCEEEA